MLTKITAKEFVNRVLSVLYRHKKYQIAVEDDYGKIKLIRSPLISEFLNPKKNRTHISKGIAKNLFLLFRYYLYPVKRSGTDNSEEIDFDFQFRTILFLYTLAPIDLSFLCADKDTQKELAEERCEKLEKIMQDLFDAYIGKEELSGREIANTVFKAVSSEPYLIFSVSSDIFINVWTIFQYSHKKYNELLKAKYNHSFFFTMNEFHITDSEIACKLKENLENAHRQLFHELTSLNVKNMSLAMRRYLIGGFMWLAYCECPESVLKDFSDVYKRIQNQKAEIKSVLKETEKIIYILLEAMKLLRIQIRLYNHCAEIGCRYDKFLMPRVQTRKDFVNNMILFLFSGIVSKAGRRNSEDNEKFNYSEKENDTILKYLSDTKDSVKLSARRIENLLNRVKYYLYPERRISEKETAVPAQFISRLWQLYIYVFGIDFSVLIPDENDSEDECHQKKEDWCTLVEMTLSRLDSEMTVSEFCAFLGREHNRLMKKYQSFGSQKFTRKELNQIMRLDIAAAHFYDDTVSQFRNVQFVGVEAQDMAFIRIRNLTDATIELLENTVGIVKNLAYSQELKDFMQQWNTDHINQVNISHKNWKIGIHECWCNDNLHRICITEQQLSLFLYCLSACCIADCLYDFKFNISSWNDKIKSCLARLDRIQQTNPKSEQQKQENQEYFESPCFKNMYEVIELANNYLMHCKWMHKNLKWTERKTEIQKSLMETLLESPSNLFPAS